MCQGQLTEGNVRINHIDYGKTIIFDTHGSFEIQYRSPQQILLDFAAHSSFLELVTSPLGCDPGSL